MFANIMARVNKDGAWAQIVSIYDNKKRVSYDEFFGVTTPSMSTKGSIMSQEVEEYYLKAIMGEKNIDQTWDSFVSTWYKIGGTEVVNEINQWYLSEGYKG
jgi:putative aldouronate transport system substrate-binding protein